MRILGFPVGRREARNVQVAQSAPDFLEQLGLVNMGLAAADVVVTPDTALGVPAVWSAVNFISGTIAGLPVHVYRRQADSTRLKDDRHPVARLLRRAVNDETTSFNWRKGLFDAVLTGGRALSFVERSADGKRITAIWPLDPTRVKITRNDGRTVYDYKDRSGRTFRYAAAEVIDMAFMLKPDGLNHRSPISQCRDAIGLAIAATQFGSKFFQNGGVPPFALKGGFQTGAAMSRAASDLEAATRAAAKEKRQALVLPQGLDIVPLGADAQKSQFVELKRFCIEEVARIFSLPPVFLQDLTHGTFSNTEQQDLHFVKHTLKRWIEAFEQELNLKFFGQDESRYIEFNMDGLLRGDFKTRMEGLARAIQTGQLTPNEAREMDNRAPADGGGKLYMQGAMMPIDGTAADVNGGTDNAGT